MNRALTIGFATLLSATCWGQDATSVILPGEEAKSVSRLCSRSGPQRIDASWTPTASDIVLLERHLADALKTEIQSHGSKMPISNPFSFHRQYVGIIVNGKRLIYINAFGADYVPNYWKTILVNVCDGGPAFWGMIYDPASGQFSDLQTNGVA